MSSLMKIKKEIKNLPEHDFIALREWFQDLDSKKWDNQIESDMINGKLDNLVNKIVPNSAIIRLKN